MAIIRSVLFLGTVAMAQTSSPCSLCEGGAPISIPDKLISLPGVGEFTCGQLEMLVPQLIPDATAHDCTLIRSLSSLCGCPSVREDGCRLCGAEKAFGIGFPDKEVPMYSPLPVFRGNVPTCALVEAYLTSVSALSDDCSFATTFVYDYCGCHHNAENATEPETPEGEESNSESCLLCKEGTQYSLDDAVTTSPFESCWQLEQAASSFVRSGSSECLSLSRIAEVQGCQCRDFSGPCDFCSGNGPISAQGKTLSFLSSEFGHEPTCLEVSEYARTISSDSPKCKDLQLFGSSCGCGVSLGCTFQCSKEDDRINDANLMKPLGSELTETLDSLSEGSDLQLNYNCELLQTVITSESEGQQSSEICRQAHMHRDECGCNIRSQCNLCGGKGEISRPDRKMNFLQKEFGYAPTCREFADYVQKFEVFENGCRASLLFGAYCGCPSLGTCYAECTEESPEPPEAYRNKDLGAPAKTVVEYFFLNPGEDPGIKFDATCSMLGSAAQTTDNGDEYCAATLSGAHDQCGCNAGDAERFYFHHFGSNSIRGDNILIWTMRISGIISTMAAICILIDIARNPRRCSSLYHQIVAAMSVFDIIFSLAYAFARTPIPADGSQKLQSENLYGTAGTQATCKAQGFAIQLGTTSIFYNAALASFLLFSASYGFAPHAQKKLKPWLLYPPLCAGVILAVGCIPFIEGSGIVCYVSSAYFSSYGWAPFVVFFCVPVVSVIGYSTIVMILAYCKVKRLPSHVNRSAEQMRHSEAGVQAYTMEETTSQAYNCHHSDQLRARPASESYRLEREMILTGVLYLLNIYIVWTIFMTSAFRKDLIQSNYAYWIVNAILTPFQGALNSIAYFRVRVTRFMKKKCSWPRGRKDRSQPGNDEAVGHIISPIVGANECAQGISLYK